MQADISHNLVVNTSDWKVDCASLGELRVELTDALEYRGLVSVQRREGRTDEIENGEARQEFPLMHIAELLQYEITAAVPYFTGDINGFIIDSQSGRVLWIESIVYDLFGLIPLCFATSRVSRIDRVGRFVLLEL